MKKYIFLHNPKCAGSTVHSYLPNQDWHNLNAVLSIKEYNAEQRKKANNHGYDCKPHHYTLEQYKNMNTFKPEKFCKAWKFTFIRNPFDRLVSAYHYSQDTSGVWKDLSFENFVDKAKEVMDCKKYYEWFGPIQPNHLCAQHLYVYDENNRFIPDYVGRHENFDVDVKNILEHLGLDIPDQIARINTTPNRSFYREYYDTSTKKIVEKIYEKDLNLFGYEF